MTTLTCWLMAATLPVIAGIAFLALLRVGIARQERAASLATRPSGLAAALARCVLGLHADPPCPAIQPRPHQRERAHSARSGKPGTP